MKEFPSTLNVKNKEKFSSILYNRTKSYMRRDIFEQILKGDENDYFSLDQFKSSKGSNLAFEMIKKMSDEIILELNKLGWKCKYSFGGTGLFIYSTETPPVSCWDE